jgi:hypothetical protein
MNEPFRFNGDKGDPHQMSSLERGTRIREEVQRKGMRDLGDGPGGWETDIHGEEGMWSVGAAFENLILDQEESE